MENKPGINLTAYMDAIEVTHDDKQFVVYPKTEKGLQLVELKIYRDITPELDSPEDIERIRQSPNKSQVVSDDGKRLLTQIKFDRKYLRTILASLYAYEQYEPKFQTKIENNAETQRSVSDAKDGGTDVTEKH